MSRPQPNLNREDMRNQLHPMNHQRSQQESQDRQRADADQQHIDGTRNTLAAAAMAAVFQVLVVVGVTVTEPLVALLPVQPLLAVQLVALVLLQVSVALLPEAIVPALAESVTVGGGVAEPALLGNL